LADEFSAVLADEVEAEEARRMYAGSLITTQSISAGEKRGEVVVKAEVEHKHDPGFFVEWVFGQENSNWKLVRARTTLPEND
jgi:hypothetical protein